jgi:hypothetical protein
MNDFSYRRKININIVINAETKDKNLNFSDLKVITNVTIHNIKITKSLNKKSLLIGGIEEFIYPNLYVRYNGFIRAISVKKTMAASIPIFFEFFPLLKYSKPVLTTKISPRYKSKYSKTFTAIGIFPKKIRSTF